ncbi:Ig-like domain-containing protein [Corynebacterium breve]|uniref:Ig-like domain-containing protein n=1 Tax=Corynebacterium breve TaxID=3049799 RepID=A0ABY8VCP8_9CORY|nr:Ig-like domain-containing protein [Corynebacterium breve]WIM67229.1 Ig-like domain-containing protein [Corynebacterium breve]
MGAFFAAKRWGALALVFAVGAATVGCTIDGGSGVSPAVDSRPAADAAQEEIEAPPKVSVADEAEDISPREPVVVTSKAGLESVEMVNENGKVVQAEMNDDSTEWTTAEVLGYNRTYTIEATDVNGETTKTTFYTATPDYTTGVALGPLQDSVVGVGQAVTFRFTNAPSDREAVEKAITVETSNDTEGGFYWIDPNELRWRPKEFWEPGTTVTVKADIYGLDMGKGLYGNDDNETSFTIGDDIRATVDDSAKTLTVTSNGEVLRTIPVSLGKDGGRWATPNGIYVVGDEHQSLTMDSATFGYSIEDGGYKTDVKYATQLSYSGIYVHGAPWATGALGSYNQSHGCINMTNSDAQWFQETVKRGDPVTVENSTGETLAGWDGLGYWNIDWETWQAGNTETGSAF